MENFPEFDFTEYKISDDIAYMEEQKQCKRKSVRLNSNPGIGGINNEKSEIYWNEDSRMRAIELRCQDIVFYGSRNVELFVSAKVKLDDLLSELTDKWETCGSCTTSVSHVRQRSKGFTSNPQRRRNLWPISPKPRSGEGGKNKSIKLGDRTSKKSVEIKGKEVHESLTPPPFKEEYILPTPTKGKEMQHDNNVMFKTPPPPLDDPSQANCDGGIFPAGGAIGSSSSWWGTPYGSSDATDVVGK